MKNNFELKLIMQSAQFFLSFSFLDLNHVRKVRKRLSLSRFCFQAIILRFFTEMLTCVVCVFRLPWATMLFSLGQVMTQGERSVKRKRRQNSNCTRTIAGSPPFAAP